MLCGCLRKQEEIEEIPTPLDAPLDRMGSCGVAYANPSRPRLQLLSFPHYNAKGLNFDFIAGDNGDHYIAKYRSTRNGEVWGFDSNPIPKAVFDKFHVIKKRKRGIVYRIDIDTGGVELFQYFRKIDEETARQLGVVLQ